MPPRVMELRRPVPAPLLVTNSVILETVFTKVLGNERVDPSCKARTLFVSGSTYATEKLGNAVVPASVPEMELLPRIIRNEPLDDPACAGENTNWKRRP